MPESKQTDVREIDDLSALPTTVNTSEPGTEPESHPYMVTIAVHQMPPLEPFVLRRGIDDEHEARTLYAKVEASLAEGTAHVYRAELRATLTGRVMGSMSS